MDYAYSRPNPLPAPIAVLSIFITLVLIAPIGPTVRRLRFITPIFNTSP